MKVAFLLLSTAFAFPDNCPNVTVVHDVKAEKWYDGCLGLDKKEELTTAAACEADCKANMKCNVWQMTKTNCWSGAVVHGCRSRGSDAKLKNFEEDLVAGQRLQHGFIKLVAKHTKQETLGLKHYPETTGTQAEMIERCKQFCYDDTTCTVWEFGAAGTAKLGKDAAGCWLEHAATNPKGETKTDSDFAKSMVAGETIEHTCPPYVVPEEGLPWAWIIAGIVLGLAALGAIIFALQKKPKVKKTRAVKIEPKPEPAPVLFIPQPTMLVPQQSIILQPQYQPVMMEPQYQPVMMMR